MTKLGFGKHGDDDIEDVPENYLLWLINSSQDKINLCRNELDRRSNRFNNSWMTRIVQDGFMAVSLGLPGTDLILATKARDALLRAIKEAANPTAEGRNPDNSTQPASAQSAPAQGSVPGTKP
jgi:hypothetical protein